MGVWIAQDQVGKYWVSTVWHGLGGRRVVWETLVVANWGEFAGYRQTYGSEEEALEGHKELVAKIRAAEYDASVSHRT